MRERFKGNIRMNMSEEVEKNFKKRKKIGYQHKFPFSKANISPLLVNKIKRNEIKKSAMPDWKSKK